MRTTTLLLALAILLCSTAFSQTDSVKIAGAEFPGGLDSLYRCLEADFRISRTDLQFDQHQDLYADVRMTINKKGEVIMVNTGQSRIEYELERALMSLPPFVPATRDGKPVTSYVELKFMFFIAGNRMQVTDHMQFYTYTREKDNAWMKAALVAGAVVIFLILWGG
ncbi:MAG: hypothetical protein R6V49_06235 [Bacteroidales bacterium]